MMVSLKEYKRRVDVAERALTRLEDKVDAAIVVGSMAYGNTSNVIRDDSGFDVVLIKSFRRLDDLRAVPYLKDSITDGLIRLGSEGACNVCTFNFEMKKIKFSMHFWDYSALQNVVLLEGVNKRYTSSVAHAKMEMIAEGLRGDSGRFVCKYRTNGHGCVSDLPVMEEDNDLYLFVQPMNLILSPIVVYDRGIQLDERIGWFWTRLAEAYKRVFGEYDKEHPLTNAVPYRIRDNMSIQSRVNIEKRLMTELKKVEERERRGL